MAYDPEARQQSNSAMTIGIVALVLLVLGAVAYFATQGPRDTVVTAPSTHTERTIVETAPQNPPPPVVVHDAAPPVVVHDGAPVVVHDGAPTKIIERNNTVTHDRIVSPPVKSGDTNVTVNVPPAPDRDTAQPQAGSDAGTTPAERPVNP